MILVCYVTWQYVKVCIIVSPENSIAQSYIIILQGKQECILRMMSYDCFGTGQLFILQQAMY